MTKEELFEALNYNDGDMVYVVRVRDTGKGFTQQRINHGMHPYMLLGVADIIREEVLRQISGELKPRVIETERAVIE
jgi:hypothetical protein